jgi:quercetin dioxygenase-like cupin family protein
MTTATTRPTDPAGIHRATEGRWFLDTWMKVLCDSASTGGAMSVIDWQGGAGFSPPLHVHHDEDTAMLVLEGVLTIQVGDAEWSCGPGELAWLPRDVAHTFRVDSESAHYLEIITPAGFEKFHVEGSREVTGEAFLPDPTPVDVPRLAAHAAAHNCDIIGPPMGAQ